MKRQWTPEELVEQWTLLPRDLALLANKHGPTRLGFAPEVECRHEMFVAIRWERRTLAVPLSQLAAIATDEMTQQAIEDWHYWVTRGYEY